MMTDESRVRLLGARVGMDLVCKRGYYICDQSGMWYLTNRGEWVLGIVTNDAEHFWSSKSAASAFLMQQKEEAGMNER